MTLKVIDWSGRTHEIRGGKLFHGSAQVFRPGDILEPGHGTNFEESGNSVSVTSVPDRAAYWTRVASGEGFVYEVEAIGPVEVWRIQERPDETSVLWEGRVLQARIVKRCSKVTKLRGKNPTRRYYEDQFAEARTQWGPGTETYDRRKRRREARRKNASNPLHDLRDFLEARAADIDTKGPVWWDNTSLNSRYENHLVELFTDLDKALTQQREAAYGGTQEDHYRAVAQELLETGRLDDVLYLADGGYSRLQVAIVGSHGPWVNLDVGLFPPNTALDRWDRLADAPRSKNPRRTRRREARRKNPACPPIPEKLTAKSVQKVVADLNLLNRGVIAGIRTEDPQRAKAASKLGSAYQHEAFATLFFRCDRLAGRSPKEALARTLKLVAMHYGEGFVANLRKVLPALLGGGKVGKTPHSKTTRALHDESEAPVVAEEGRDLGPELRAALPRIQEILDRLNKSNTSRFKKHSHEALVWKIRRAEEDYVEMEHAYAPTMRRGPRQFQAGVTPWNPTVQGLGSHDKLSLVLHRTSKKEAKGGAKWAYYLTASCSVDGEPVRSAYRMVPEGKTTSLPGVREVTTKDPTLGFEDLDTSLKALPGILGSLSSFTYEYVCDSKPLALQDGDRLEFALEARERRKNPGLLIPGASVLVTAAALGDSLFELHSALRT